MSTVAEQKAATTTKRFELNDKVARLYENDEVVKEIASDVFIAAYNGRALGVLPAAVRWMSDSFHIGLIYERPPSTWLFGNGEHAISVALPWTVWAIKEGPDNRNDVWAFARPLPIMSMQDELYQLPLPGFSADGRYELLRPKRAITGANIHEIVTLSLHQIPRKDIEGEITQDAFVESEIFDDVETYEELFASFNKFGVGAELIARLTEVPAPAFPTIEALSKELNAHEELDGSVYKACEYVMLHRV